jgi:hypothetical protein
MSGLEIPALVATIIGTGAAGISAYKAMKKRGTTYEAIERTWNVRLDISSPDDHV